MPGENQEQKPKIFDACPHCGHKLSPWQQVLLSVDRVITCKNCWYRIILDIYEKEAEESKRNQEGKKD